MRKDRKKMLVSPSHRVLKVGEEIRHLLSNIFMREEIHLPGISSTLITVTEDGIEGSGLLQIISN
jgi:ribosome-binding factor A